MTLPELVARASYLLLPLLASVAPTPSLSSSSCGSGIVATSSTMIFCFSNSAQRTQRPRARRRLVGYGERASEHDAPEHHMAGARTTSEGSRPNATNHGTLAEHEPMSRRPNARVYEHQQDQLDDSHRWQRSSTSDVHHHHHFIRHHKHVRFTATRCTKTSTTVPITRSSQLFMMMIHIHGR